MTANTALFDIEKRNDGWTVIDLTTGNPAVVDGVSQIGLELEDADDLADLLTTQKWQNQKSKFRVN